MKKVFLFLLVIIMVAGSLAGCADNSGSAGSGRAAYKVESAYADTVPEEATPEDDGESPLVDPTMEAANAVSCISFAALYQWYGSVTDGTKAEREKLFFDAFNAEFRRYPDIRALFEHVAPGTGGAKVVEFKTQPYSEFLKSSGWKAVWNTYYSPADRSYHQQKKVGRFSKAGYNIPANDRTVGIFGFDLNGDGKTDKWVHALLECFNILTEREVIKNIPKPTPTPAPTPTPTPAPVVDAKEYSLAVKYVRKDDLNKELATAYTSTVKAGAWYNLTEKTQKSISGWVRDSIAGDTPQIKGYASQDVVIYVKYYKASGGGSGGSGGSSGGGSSGKVFDVTIEFKHVDDKDPLVVSPYTAQTAAGGAYDVRGVISGRQTLTSNGRTFYATGKVDGTTYGTATANVKIVVYYETREWQQLPEGRYYVPDGSGEVIKVEPEAGAPKDEPGTDIPSQSNPPAPTPQPIAPGTESVTGTPSDPI
ncbi:MAG: hypothetical protein LBQ02_04315 [Candidatus Nomurabacteria bacterium]|jgi:hypothetical protein|nr:hypothetical protein [Candidatus Nomurabacteria bacterium]